MWPLYKALSNAICRAVSGQDTTDISASALPDAWTAWSLVNLIRHRERQLWVGDIVRHRLGGDLGRISQVGAAGHPTGRPCGGLVPGQPEWEYRFHGCGCCLSHRVSGEVIDVDFADDSAEGLSPWFYLYYLRSLRNPDPPERRLIELHPSIDTVELAFDTLAADGVLVQVGRRTSVRRLAPAAIAIAADVTAFCRAWSDPTRRSSLARAIGDWDAAGDGPRTAAARDARGASAERAIDAGLVRLGLQALYEAGAVTLQQRLRQTLRGELGANTSKALDLIVRLPGFESWRDDVADVLRRADPNGSGPGPLIWIACIRLLLQDDRGSAAAGRLIDAGPRVADEAALLAWEFAPQHAVDLFRRALRSTVPGVRSGAAAALALVDRPWSRRELLVVLAGSDDPLATAECRAALSESREPEVRASVIEWERRHPYEPERGKWVSMDELQLRMVDPLLQAEMDSLRDRVHRLSATTLDPVRRP